MAFYKIVTSEKGGTTTHWVTASNVETAKAVALRWTGPTATITSVVTSATVWGEFAPVADEAV